MLKPLIHKWSGAGIVPPHILLYTVSDLQIPEKIYYTTNIMKLTMSWTLRNNDEKMCVPIQYGPVWGNSFDAWLDESCWVESCRCGGLNAPLTFLFHHYDNTVKETGQDSLCNV